MTMTMAARATPMATRVPSWANPGRPPRFKTRKALMVVIAAQRMLGAMARRTCRIVNCGWDKASW